MTSDRWMGVAHSSLPDARAAALEATSAAVAGRDATLLLVYAAITYDAAELSAGIAAAAPGVPVIGCSTHGEIAPDGPRDGSVLVTALGGLGLYVATAASDTVNGRQREAGVEVAACVAEVGDHPYRVLILLTDGLARDQETILRGAYSVAGSQVPLFGGAAGDSWRMSGTFQLHGTTVLTNGVVAACLASDAPMGIGIRHGWHPVGEPMIVTESADGRVYGLDDEPALDAYLRRIDAPSDLADDSPELTRYVLSRPLGVQRRSGVEVRNMSTEVDVKGRSIGGGGALPLGGLTWAMAGDVESVLDASEDACRDAVATLGGRPAIGMLTFSCAACRAVLGDDGIVREHARLAGVSDGVPFAGFYTYGEIARTKGIDGFHNQTMVVLALS